MRVSVRYGILGFFGEYIVLGEDFRIELVFVIFGIYLLVWGLSFIVCGDVNRKLFLFLEDL